MSAATFWKKNVQYLNAILLLAFNRFFSLFNYLDMIRNEYKVHRPLFVSLFIYIFVK